jgi:hypothetical protein
VTSALSVVLVVEAHDEAKTVGRATSSLPPGFDLTKSYNKIAEGSFPPVSLLFSR